jgi:hypothetical protein
MLPQADLTLYDRDGRQTAMVEIKNKLGTSGEWAAKLRQNLLAHGGFRGVDFFLLVTPDRLYLWKEDAGGKPVPVEPAYEIDVRPLLQPYFARAGLNPATVSGQAFELIVAAWLADLMRWVGVTEKREIEQRWLLDSGFLGAVSNGRVEYDLAA